MIGYWSNQSPPFSTLSLSSLSLLSLLSSVLLFQPLPPFPPLSLPPSSSLPSFSIPPSLSLSLPPLPSLSISSLSLPLPFPHPLPSLSLPIPHPLFPSLSISSLPTFPLPPFSPHSLSFSLSSYWKVNQMNSMYFIDIKVVMSERHLRYGGKNVVKIDLRKSWVHFPQIWIKLNIRT